MNALQPSQTRAFKSTNDLSAKQFFAVALDTATQNSVVLANAQTLPTIGILLNAPVAGDTAEVLLFNRTCFGIAGGTIAIGDHLTVDAAGKLITTTTPADQVVGRAIDAAVSGDRFEFIVADKFYHA